MSKVGAITEASVYSVDPLESTEGAVMVMRRSLSACWYASGSSRSSLPLMMRSR
jgi:hypothetical protein